MKDEGGNEREGRKKGRLRRRMEWKRVREERMERIRMRMEWKRREEKRKD